MPDKNVESALRYGDHFRGTFQAGANIGEFGNGLRVTVGFRFRHA